MRGNSTRLTHFEQATKNLLAMMLIRICHRIKENKEGFLQRDLGRKSTAMAKRISSLCLGTVALLCVDSIVQAFPFDSYGNSCRRTKKVIWGHGTSLYSTHEPVTETASSGLYRKFSDHAWKKLEESGLFRPAEIPSELQKNQAPAKGLKDLVVKISTQAMIPTTAGEGLVRYARVALLETVSINSTESVQSTGIQVLNLVVIPSQSTLLPVLGIDLVTLPGGKHLLLLDAQPMTHPNPFEVEWHEWHLEHVSENSNFPWGGDFPEAVQQYVSKYALWTRLQELEDPVSIIENQVWEAFVGHLDIYLEVLKRFSAYGENSQGQNHQDSYLEYRRMNDPAKPMLNSLYGSNWTERVLDEVLFPR